VIDKNRAWLHAGECARLTNGDCTQVVIVADATKNKIRAFSSCLRRDGSRARIVVDPALGRGGGPVIDRDFVTCFGQLTRHRVTHNAQADKRNFESHEMNL
jgi:hypothetical protein